MLLCFLLARMTIQRPALTAPGREIGAQTNDFGQKKTGSRTLKSGLPVYGLLLTAADVGLSGHGSAHLLFVATLFIQAEPCQSQRMLLANGLKIFDLQQSFEALL